MQLFSKFTLARLAALTLLIAGAAFPAPPAMAANSSSPAFDITGNWKASSDGSVETIYQENKRVTMTAINAGWAHTGNGFYISAKKVHVVILRRNRDSSGCETSCGSCSPKNGQR